MSSKTILYIEDNEMNRKIVRDLLRRTKYELVEAHDGEAGVAKALETYDSVMVRRDLEAEGGFAQFFARSEADTGAATARRRAAAAVRARIGMKQRVDETATPITRAGPVTTRRRGRARCRARRRPGFARCPPGLQCARRRACPAVPEADGACQQQTPAPG